MHEWNTSQTSWRDGYLAAIEELQRMAGELEPLMRGSGASPAVPQPIGSLQYAASKLRARLASSVLALPVAVGTAMPSGAERDWTEG